MKIEELPHINIKRRVFDNERWLSISMKKLMEKKGYVPMIDTMADSYSILSRLLDGDCVVAYATDKSQTTFLVKTRQQYVGFICLSEKIAKYLSSNSTRTITRMYDWTKGFIDFTEDLDLIIADKDKWDKYLKTKLLESLGK